jgi:hypothetical protein
MNDRPPPPFAFRAADLLTLANNIRASPDPVPFIALLCGEIKPRRTRTQQGVA